MRGARSAQMMLGEPHPVVPQRLGVSGVVQRVGQRIRLRGSGSDRPEVDDGQFHRRGSSVSTVEDVDPTGDSWFVQTCFHCGRGWRGRHGDRAIFERDRTTTGPTVPLATAAKSTRRPDREGWMLGDDRTAARGGHRLRSSGRRARGPAGAGKTTAMSGLGRGWEREHGKGSVVGLAPSAVAAQALADDLGIATENTANRWTTTSRPAGPSTPANSRSWTKSPGRRRLTGPHHRAHGRRGVKALLVGGYAQPDRSTPAARSRCSIGPTRPNSSMSTASPMPGRRPPCTAVRSHRGHRHLHRPRPRARRRHRGHDQRGLHRMASRHARREGHGAGHRL